MLIADSNPWTFSLELVIVYEYRLHSESAINPDKRAGIVRCVFYLRDEITKSCKRRYFDGNSRDLIILLNVSSCSSICTCDFAPL